jgi:hypothetical protein
MYRGDDVLAGKACSTCGFIAALVVAARYVGRQMASYETASTTTTLMLLWFVLWGIVAAIYCIRASRFRADEANG